MLYQHFGFIAATVDQQAVISDLDFRSCCVDNFNAAGFAEEHDLMPIADNQPLCEFDFLLSQVFVNPALLLGYKVINIHFRDIIR